jgi:hypothetical protein
VAGLIDVAVNPFATAPVANQADLSVAASGGTTTFNGKVSVSYFVTVKNLGPATASAAALGSTPLACSKLPGSSAFGCTVSTSQGSCTVGGLTGNRIGCNFGDIASGASVTVRVGGSTFISTPTDVTSTFSAFSNTFDAMRANNSADVTVTLTEPVIDIPVR